MPTVLRQQDVTIIELGAEYDSLDAKGLEEVESMLLEQARTAEPPLLVLDLSHTSFIGSGFIEAVSRAWKRLKMRGGHLVLCGVHNFVAEVLQTMRLDTLWRSFPSRDAAVASLLQVPASE